MFRTTIARRSIRRLFPRQLEHRPVKDWTLPPIPISEPKIHKDHVEPVTAKVSVQNLFGAPVLPTTFPAGVTEKSYKQALLQDDEPIREPGVYPYKYYQVSLVRGVIGLPEKTRKIVKRLGLTKRMRVVYAPVGVRAAKQILAIKELVRVRLVNTIPQKVPTPSGYRKIDSVFR